MENTKLKKYMYNNRIIGIIGVIIIFIIFMLCDTEGVVAYKIIITILVILLILIILKRVIESMLYKLALKRGKEYIGVIDKAVYGRDRDAGGFVTFKIVYKRNEKYKYKWTRLYERNKYEGHICAYYDTYRFTCKLYRYMGIMVLDKESIEEDENWNYKKHGWGI